MGAILKEMAILTEAIASRPNFFLGGHSLFENGSLVDFQIGNEQKLYKIAGSKWFLI